MKIVFVRHGHPNYEKDCLTELGHEQAKAAAERLKGEKFDMMFSSSCGRAYETACHIAKSHRMEVQKLDFMREISWGEPGTEDFIHPWSKADEWVKNDRDVICPEWREDEDYKGHTVVESYNRVSADFDLWLEGFGLKREGKYYRIVSKCDSTVMLASHGGSSSVVLSHIFNLPFTFVCRSICPGFTAITEVSFEGEAGELTSPKFLLLNDIGHIKGLTAENYYGR